MMDRMPKFEVSELKPGDALMILHTKGAKADELTAITAMAGVEPILTAPAGRDPMAGMGGMMGEMGGMGGGAGVP
jgi:anthranilate phosphoribosyltransferase